MWSAAGNSSSIIVQQDRNRLHRKNYLLPRKMSWKRDKIVQIKTFKRKLGLKALRAQLHIKANPFSKQLLFMFPLMYITISQDPTQKINAVKIFYCNQGHNICRKYSVYDSISKIWNFFINFLYAMIARIIPKW